MDKENSMSYANKCEMKFHSLGNQQQHNQLSSPFVPTKTTEIFDSISWQLTNVDKSPVINIENFDINGGDEIQPTTLPMAVVMAENLNTILDSKRSELLFNNFQQPNSQMTSSNINQPTKRQNSKKNNVHENISSATGATIPSATPHYYTRLTASEPKIKKSDPSLGKVAGIYLMRMRCHLFDYVLPSYLCPRSQFSILIEKKLSKTEIKEIWKYTKEIEKIAKWEEEQEQLAEAASNTGDANANELIDQVKASIARENQQKKIRQSSTKIKKKIMEKFENKNAAIATKIITKTESYKQKQSSVITNLEKRNKPETMVKSAVNYTFGPSSKTLAASKLTSSTFSQIASASVSQETDKLASADPKNVLKFLGF